MPAGTGPTVVITPDELVRVSQHIDARVEEAAGIARAYLATQENAMGAQTWSGDGTNASHLVATQVNNDLTKVLHGGGGLAKALAKAAAIMAAGDADDQQAYQQLHDPTSGATAT